MTEFLEMCARTRLGCRIWTAPMTFVSKSPVCLITAPHNPRFNKLTYCKVPDGVGLDDVFTLFLLAGISDGHRMANSYVGIEGEGNLTCA